MDMVPRAFNMPEGLDAAAVTDQRLRLENGQMNRLRGKGAVVIGGANGIGAQVAIRFAGEGAAVMVVDVATAAGETLAAELVAAGHVCEFVTADATDLESMRSAVGRAVEQFGQLQCVVHSVLRNHRAPITELTEAQWRDTLAGCLDSAYVTAHLTIPAMVAAGGGSLTFISSIHARFGLPHDPAYAAAKAGLCGLTRQLAVDYGSAQVRVNAILPGLVLVDRISSTMGHPEQLAEASARFPLGRVGTPNDIAGAAAFLASDDAAWITGIELLVDGGRTAQGGRTSNQTFKR